jgi:ferrous iron transport protein A
MKEKHVRLLSSVKAGEKVRLVSINAGHGLKSRLTAMGLLPDEEVTVVSNGQPGPIVIGVKDSKVMLGRGMADKIMVI